MKFFIKQQQKQTIFTNYTLNIYTPVRDNIKQGSIHMALQFVLNHLVIWVILRCDLSQKAL